MIYLGADHAGFELKEFLTHQLASRGVAFEDFGTFSSEPADFPIVAKKVAKAVIKSHGRGILVCGTGAGMCIATNRLKGIRAATMWNEEVARRTREEDDVNIACLPSRIIDRERAWGVVSTFLATTFTGLDRYKRRLRQIDE